MADAPAEARAPSRSDAAWLTALALEVRLAVVIWAATRFPPTADGTYYQRIAERIAEGLGYTWLWPDGAVTYAAHYPIGYPAAVGALYALTGPRPWAAMVLNAVLGALAAYAAHRLAARAGSRPVALAAGLLVALHPGLVAYTPALMTEGVVASLVVIAASLAAWTRDRASSRFVGLVLLGLVVGAATLVRPQSLILAPLFAAIAVKGSLRRHLGAAALATLVTLAVCAPWTARNCVRMKRCALVSVNGGWNLLIGADVASTGAWSPVQVPEECREVYDEAEKDRCFGRAAQGFIVKHPLAWIGLAPRKLAATFDYAGAAGWYLHASNAEAFPERAKVGLGAVETLFERVVLVLAIAAMARRPGGEEPPWRRKSRLAVALLGVAFSLTLHAWIGFAALVVVALLRGRALVRGPVLFSAAAATVAATMAVHAAFFGAGRYSLVVFPLVTALAALAFAGLARRSHRVFDRAAPGGLFCGPHRCRGDGGKTEMALIETEEAARRLARAIASDLSLYNEEKIVQGIQSDDLFAKLAVEIEEGRALYKSRVQPDLYQKNFYDRALVDILVKSKGHIKSKIW